LEDPIAACRDTDFWKNFRKAAPIMFCVAVEVDKSLRLIRDMSFFEELMKTTQILHLLQSQLLSEKSDIDIVEYSVAVQMLETKLTMLSDLNTRVEGDSDKPISFNIAGTQKSVVIDRKKLREAIQI